MVYSARRRVTEPSSSCWASRVDSWRFFIFKLLVASNLLLSHKDLEKSSFISSPRPTQGKISLLSSSEIFFWAKFFFFCENLNFQEYHIGKNNGLDFVHHFITCTAVSYISFSVGIVIWHLAFTLSFPRALSLPIPSFPFENCFLSFFFFFLYPWTTVPMIRGFLLLLLLFVCLFYDWLSGLAIVNNWLCDPSQSPSLEFCF